jgi:hypothetical protein
MSGVLAGLTLLSIITSTPDGIDTEFFLLIRNDRCIPYLEYWDEPLFLSINCSLPRPVRTGHHSISRGKGLNLDMARGHSNRCIPCAGVPGRENCPIIYTTILRPVKKIYRFLVRNTLNASCLIRFLTVWRLPSSGSLGILMLILYMWMANRTAMITSAMESKYMNIASFPPM